MCSLARKWLNNIYPFSSSTTRSSPLTTQYKQFESSIQHAFNNGNLNTVKNRQFSSSSSSFAPSSSVSAFRFLYSPASPRRRSVWHRLQSLHPKGGRLFRTSKRRSAKSSSSAIVFNVEFEQEEQPQIDDEPKLVESIQPPNFGTLTGFSGNSGQLVSPVWKLKDPHSRQQQQSRFVDTAAAPVQQISYENFERLFQYELHVERHTIMLTQALHHASQPISPNVSVKASTPLPPAGYEIECKVQPCPQLVRKQLSDLFPGIQLPLTLTVISIAHKTTNSMAAWTPDMESEREKLHASFVAVAQRLCNSLRRGNDGTSLPSQKKYWADFIDPGTGKPYFSAYTQASLFETDDAFQRLGFYVSDLGCCKFIEHTAWGAYVFVGTLFTDAPCDAPALQNFISMQQKQQQEQQLSSDIAPVAPSTSTAISDAVIIPKV